MSQYNQDNKMKNFDDVNGTIIGDILHKIALVAPNGKEQIKNNVDNEFDAKEWAENEKNRLLSEPCGNGKSLSSYPDIVEQIYGKGEWSLRIYDLDIG
jgi:hypothetical protein